MHIWLRQVCLVVRDLHAVAGTIARVFDTRVTHGSGDLTAFGLPPAETMHGSGREFLERTAGVTNVTLPIGNDFLELIAPTREDSAAARHLVRRGGDGGYMFVLQAEGIPRWRAHMQAAGARIVRTIDHEGYEAFHIHPADIGAAIVSLGSVRPVNDPRGPWYPAAWRPEDGRLSLIDGYAGATVDAELPAALARRWQQVFELPLAHAGDDTTLAFDNASLRFARAGKRGNGISTLTLATRHADQVRERARAARVLTADGGIAIGGIRFELASADLGAPHPTQPPGATP